MARKISQRGGTSQNLNYPSTRFVESARIFSAWCVSAILNHHGSAFIAAVKQKRETPELWLLVGWYNRLQVLASIRLPCAPAGGRETYRLNSWDRMGGRKNEYDWTRFVSSRVVTQDT